jgi:hypothetical protein
LSEIFIYQQVSECFVPIYRRKIRREETRREGGRERERKRKGKVENERASKKTERTRERSPYITSLNTLNDHG